MTIILHYQKQDSRKKILHNRKEKKNKLQRMMIEWLQIAASEGCCKKGMEFLPFDSTVA